MQEREEILNGLPSSRDDEPETLRADIIDELTDHLQCAFNRELHSQASSGRQATDSDPESRARHRALTRFGNPAAIARRLWYDAMKDRIMSQRLTMAAAIVAACACVGMFGLMWRSIGTQQQHIDALTLQMREDADEAARQRDQLQALLAESQEANHELAESVTTRLNSMEQRAAETSEWNPVEFRLVQGSEDGPPAVGFSIQLANVKPETERIPGDMRTSGESGVVRFERVRYGIYDATITTPWEEYYHQQVLLEPGESYSRTVICPADAPQPIEVQLAVDWPQDLAGRAIFLQVNPGKSYRLVDGAVWSTSKGAFGRTWSSRRSMFISPDGVILHEREPDRFFGNRDTVFVMPDDTEGATRTIEWPGVDYEVAAIGFLAPVTLDDPSPYAGYVVGEEIWSLEEINGAVLRPGADNPLERRVEEGTPQRIIYEPTAEVVNTLREYFAEHEAEEESAELLRVSDTATKLAAGP